MQQLNFDAWQLLKLSWCCWKPMTDFLQPTISRICVVPADTDCISYNDHTFVWWQQTWMQPLLYHYSEFQKLSSESKCYFVTWHEVNHGKQSGKNKGGSEDGQRRHRLTEWQESGGTAKGEEITECTLIKKNGREERRWKRRRQGLIRHLGYCSQCDRQPSSHSGNFTG